MTAERNERNSSGTFRPSTASVGRGVLWSAGGAAATQLISFCAFLLIARALDPATFGLVAFAAIFVAVLAVFVEQGFTQALVQRQSLEHEHLNTAFWTNLGLSLGLMCLMLVSAGVVSAFFAEEDLPSVLRVLSLSLLLGAFSGVQTAILQREMRFAVLTTRTLTGTIFGACLGIGLAWAGYGVWALVGQTLLAQLVTAIGLWGATGWRPSRSFSGARLRELWRFGLNVLGSNLVNVANHRATEFIIGALLGKQSLGLYSVSAKIQAALTQLFVHTVTRVSLTTLSRFQEEPEVFRRAQLTGVRLTATLTFPTFFGIAVLAPEITEVVLGPQWGDAAPIMSILAFLGVVTTVGSLNATAIASLGHPQYNLRLDALNTLVTVGVVTAASPWGLQAVAAAFVIRAFALWPLRYLVLRRLCGATFGELGNAIWGILVSASAMSLSLLWLRTWDLALIPSVELVLLIGVGALIYRLILSRLAPATLREVRELVRTALRGTAREGMAP